MRRHALRALLGCVLLLAGCVAPVQRDTAAGTASADLAEVLSGQVLFGGDPVPPLPQANILGLDAPMHEFLARFVDPDANAHLRLQQLIYAVISPATFGLQYTDDTRTAADTFRGRNGNCLSFTNLFVALARESGLKVSYQQIDIPPDWERRGDTFVLSRHINVLVDMGRNSKKAVDFNIDDFKSSYDREVVSDTRAEAHFYSNLGVEHLQREDYRNAFLHLRKALQIDAGFAPSWTNLGAVYSRSGHLRHAELSYLEALRHDSGEMVAISNLSRLYERSGDAVRAGEYRELAKFHRERNPYYRFYVAREAFLAKDYAAARRHLDYAIDKKPYEDQFYFLRGIVNLQQGDAKRARADLAKAEEIAANESLKRNYHSKMEMLLSEQPE